MKSNECGSEWSGREVRGRRKQLNKSVSVKMERETKTALNVKINDNSQAQTHSRIHIHMRMHTQIQTRRQRKPQAFENLWHNHSFIWHKLWPQNLSLRTQTTEISRASTQFLSRFRFHSPCICTPLRHLVFSFCKFHCDAFRSVLNFRFCWPLFYLFSLVWFSSFHYISVYTMPFDATHPHVNWVTSLLTVPISSSSDRRHLYLHTLTHTDTTTALCFMYLHNSLCWLYKS